jgi:DNA-directed RNA polymerase specialized sigma24 family protein
MSFSDRRPPPFDGKLHDSIRRILRARRIPDSELDDACQVVLLRAHKSERVPPQDPERTRYIHGIARNVAREYKAVERERPEIVPFDDDDHALAVEPAGHETADLVRKLHDQAAAHDAKGTEWMVRAKAYGEKEVDIARQEGVPPARVRKRIGRLLGKMRERSHALAAIGVLVVIAVAALRWATRDTQEAAPAPNAPHALPSAGASPDRAPDRARMLRERALEECDAGRGAECLRLLDQARAVDPAGDDDARVRAARSAASSR